MPLFCIQIRYTLYMQLLETFDGFWQKYRSHSNILQILWRNIGCLNIQKLTASIGSSQKVSCRNTFVKFSIYCFLWWTDVFHPSLYFCLFSTFVERWLKMKNITCNKEENDSSAQNQKLRKRISSFLRSLFLIYLLYL